MKNGEQRELEDMALALELSRQLGHDFGNFLYNLFLQMEIWEASGKSAIAPDWTHIKKDGRQLIGLLQQWQQFRNRQSVEKTSRLDVNALIRKLIKAGGRDYRLSYPATAEAPCWIVGSPIAVKHLLRLACEDLFLSCQEHLDPNPALSIETKASPEKVIVHISAPAPALHDDSGHPTLVAAASASLAMRLDAKVERGSTAAGQAMISVGFPVSSTQGNPDTF